MQIQTIQMEIWTIQTEIQTIRMQIRMEIWKHSRMQIRMNRVMRMKPKLHC